MSRSDCLQKALAEALADVVEVFPHSRMVRAPAGQKGTSRAGRDEAGDM